VVRISWFLHYKKEYIFWLSSVNSWSISQCYRVIIGSLLYRNYHYNFTRTAISLLLKLIIACPVIRALCKMLLVWVSRVSLHRSFEEKVWKTSSNASDCYLILLANEFKVDGWFLATKEKFYFILIIEFKNKQIRVWMCL